MTRCLMSFLLFFAGSISFLPVAKAPAAAPCPGAQDSGPQHDGPSCNPEFTYTPGPHGPENWGGECNIGKVQSPIEISHAVAAPLPALDFSGYQPGGLNMLNDCNHYQIKVTVAPGSTLKYGDHTYKLVQFHFHEPAEEKIAGQRRAAMVVHLVHQAEDGSLAVVAALVRPGRENALIKSLWEHIPPQGGKYENPEIEINAVALLPKDRNFYTFPGSLTTPGCNQGVTWFVLKEPIEFSPAQIAKYKTQYQGTARPLQPVNGRRIEERK